MSDDSKYHRIKQIYEDQIVDGMARALWTTAWFDSPDIGDFGGVKIAKTPLQAWDAARDLTKLWAASEGLVGPTPLADLFEIAMTFDWGTPFVFMDAREDADWGAAHNEPPTRDTAYVFGTALADMATKSGPPWSEYRTTKRGTHELEFSVPSFRIELDKGTLEWHGTATPSVRKNPPGNASLPWLDDERVRRIRAILAERDPTEACSEGCRGWDVFDSDRGYGIQACDDCNARARRRGLPTISDEDAMMLPEAQQELGETDDDELAENAGGEHSSADQIWLVQVRDRVGPFAYTTRGTYEDVQQEASEDGNRIVSITPSHTWDVPRELRRNGGQNPRSQRQRRNPRGLTRKGERMYKAIEKGYQKVGEARAKEVAARTVLSRAKHGTPGLVKTKSARSR